MLELYTASFFNKKDHVGTPCSIARSEPQMFKGTRFALVNPPGNLLLGYKSGHIKWPEYETIYNEFLDHSRAVILLNIGAFTRPVTFLCWEKTPEQCHRRLLAVWLNKHGIIIPDSHIK